jgi:hypothetical protein
MMKEINDNKGISRRTIVQGAATLAGLAAASVASLDANNAGAQTKLSHAVAKYQDGPKNGQECSTCVNFVSPAACRIVASPIGPHAWCQFYAKKTA